MSTYSKYAGQLAFTSTEKANKAKQYLLANGWMARDDKGDIYWLDEVGQEIGVGTEAAIIPLDTKILSFAFADERNIHSALGSVLGLCEGSIDNEATFLRNVCTDGMFSLSQWTGNREMDLTKDEVAEIIGFPVSEIDYANYTGKKGFATVQQKAYKWLADTYALIPQTQDAKVMSSEEMKEAATKRSTTYIISDEALIACPSPKM